MKWDEVGDRFYETGLDRGVLYLQSNSGTYPKGVAWSGLTKVSEKPTGADVSAIYADNMKWLNLVAAEEFEATLECYMYPDEFAACDGSATIADGVTIGQQSRSRFGLCYRTRIGNDIDGDSKGYKLHLIYGCYATPSQKDYQTVNDSPEAISFSYEIKTTPVEVTGHKPTACLTVDSTKVTAQKMKALETILYGTEASDGVQAVNGRLPLPDEVATIIGTTQASG